MKVTGNTLLARALLQQRVDLLFFLMGGPLIEAENACSEAGIRMIDVRHEQAAAMMAHAYARVRCGVGVCMGASGPGALNLTMGLANALIDASPVVAIGGASPITLQGREAFQEIDQIAAMRPVTKWAERVHSTLRIPEFVDRAFRQATSGKPGPVYLDLPGDVLYHEVDDEDVVWPAAADSWVVAKPAASPQDIQQAINILSDAKRPIVLSGSGTLWSKAGDELRRFVEMLGIPFYTTPQGRGVIPEDHEYAYSHARSHAFKMADVVVVIGTRLNYVFGFGRPPRFSPDARFIRIDIDAGSLLRSDSPGLGLVADAKTALAQLLDALPGQLSRELYEPWRCELANINEERSAKAITRLENLQVPIHPLRLCKEVRDFLNRDDILVVDGQEILNYARQVIPSFVGGHRLNSGPFGTMGVGLPFGIGAKAGKPDKRVVVLHGDGSFGMNCMELDTAVRHNLPVLVVISLNGGWTAIDPKRNKPGRDLGYTRYDQMARSLGCHGEYVEKVEDIGPALMRAATEVAAGRPAVVNVVTDAHARAITTEFTSYAT
jgi:acetolactate synthase-1/2/3 large subunit